MSETATANALVVDLDGTLIATDTLWESALLLCRQFPLKAAKRRCRRSWSSMSTVPAGSGSG